MRSKRRGRSGRPGKAARARPARLGARPGPAHLQARRAGLTGGGAGGRSEVRGRERRRKLGLWGQRHGIRVETGDSPSAEPAGWKEGKEAKGQRKENRFKAKKKKKDRKFRRAPNRGGIQALNGSERRGGRRAPGPHLWLCEAQRRRRRAGPGLRDALGTQIPEMVRGKNRARQGCD